MGVTELNSVNNQTKAGCCPHGLPAGVCPVCSQSGAGTLRQSDRNRKPGEMTYHECLVIGNMLKARALAQKNRKEYLNRQSLNIQAFETTITKAIQNMKEFTQILAQNFIAKPIALVLNITVLPILKILQAIPKFIQTLNNLRFEIADKLAAIFGEAKAFILKKAEEGLKVISSFFEKIFKISKKNNAEDDDTKIDDDKKIFNLKSMIQKVKEKFKQKKDKEQ